MDNNLFEKYVEREILSKNDFGILGVKKLQSLQSFVLVEGLYKQIEELILAGNLQKIKDLNIGPDKGFELLEVMTFQDQNDNWYVVTVFDSLALEQDPQVVLIYLLKSNNQDCGC